MQSFVLWQVIAVWSITAVGAFNVKTAYASTCSIYNLCWNCSVFDEDFSWQLCKRLINIIYVFINMCPPLILLRIVRTAYKNVFRKSQLRYWSKIALREGFLCFPQTFRDSPSS